MRKTLFVAISLILYGCSAGPGAPLVRVNSADGEGSLIPNCQNISNVDETNTFITDYYLTTGSSAFREGGAVGYYEGMKEGLNDARVMIDDVELKRYAYGLLPSSAIFCKTYSANPNRVFSIVSALLPQLGYRLVDASQADGLLITEFVDGDHRFPGARMPFVKWKDRYIVKIERKKDVRTVVNVFRDVYISRCNANTGECSDYIRATSVGHNEAVMLNRINRELR